MSEFFAARIVKFGIKSGTLENADKELYVYAYQIFIEQIASWLSFLIMAALFHHFVGGVVFMLFYNSLRIYAGGIHARSAGVCYISSMLIYLALFLIFPVITVFDNKIAFVVNIVCSVVIFILAPIADKNKPFEGGDYLRIKKKTKIILLIEIIFASILLCFGFMQDYYWFISFSFFLITMLLIVAKLKQIVTK